MTKLSPKDKHNLAMEYAYGASATRLAARYDIQINYVYVLIREAKKAGKIPNERHKPCKPCKDDIDLPDWVAKAQQRGRELSEANQNAVNHHINVRRGFAVPSELTNYYEQLLRSGKSLREIKELVRKKSSTLKIDT